MGDISDGIRGLVFLSIIARVIMGGDAWSEMIQKENEAYAERERNAELEWMYP